MSARSRQAGPTDRREWLALRRVLWPELGDAEHHRAITRTLADRPRHAAVLAIDEAGRACGLLEVSRRERAEGCGVGPVGWIDGIYVDPAWRGEGVGRLLLAFVLDWARATGCREVAFARPSADGRDDPAELGGGFVASGRYALYRRALAVDTPAAEAAPVAPARDAVPAVLTPARPNAARPAGPGRTPAPAAGGRLRGRSRALHAAVGILGAAGCLFADISSADIVRGGLLPLVIVGSVIWFIGAFVFHRYRHRADESARAIALFTTDTDATGGEGRSRRR